MTFLEGAQSQINVGNKPIKTADLQKDAEKVVALRRLDKATAASQRATAADDDDEEDAL